MSADDIIYHSEGVAIKVMEYLKQELPILTNDHCSMIVATIESKMLHELSNIYLTTESNLV
jgi:hypothetical protein